MNDAIEPGLGDALFQDLAVLRFLVVQEHLGIVRFVKLSLAGIDAELAEQRLHAERARLVRHDRHHPLADLRMLQQQRQHADERHGGRDFTAGRAFERLLQISSGGASIELAWHAAARHVAAQLPAALVQVATFRAVVGRPVERRVARRVVRNRNFEARAEMLDLLLVELLLLVGDVAALARLAQAVALDGLGQNQGGPALVLDRRLVGVVNLLRIVAAAAQLEDLLVAQVRDQVQQSGYCRRSCLRM